MNTIKEVLMGRDGITSDEADELIAEAREELMRRAEDGSSFIEMEDICYEYFGLEPDYLMELLP